MEAIDEDREYVLQQTIGFQRMIQRAINHARSAEKMEVNLGDILASIFQEKDSHAAFYLEAEGITRLDVLNYISHNTAPGPRSPAPGLKPIRPAGKPGQKTQKETPLEMFTVNLLKKAADGKIDPLIGRENETDRAMQVLCRRRKITPYL